MYQLVPAYRRIATAMTTIGLALGSGACLTACGSPSAISEAAASTAPGTAPAEAARSLTGFPGTLFYLTEDDALVRRSLSGDLLPAAREAGGGVDVSPDGSRIARVDADGDVMVTDADGRTPRRIYRQAAPDGYGPAWAPDGTRLLIGRQTSEQDVRPGLLDVATGRFTPLPKLAPGLHPRFSGDGRSIVFLDDCRLVVAAADGTGRRTVPAVGDENRKNNPAGSFTCDVQSVNADGSRITVDLKGSDEPAGDTAGDPAADTVIDTATGAAVALPVSGEVLSVFYRPDGSLIVRSRQAKTITLTALSATGEQIAQVVEPGPLNQLTLAAWTR